VEEIFLPAMGMAMESATLVEWLRQEGEPVTAGEEVAVVESDKSTVGLTAPASGHLGRHLFAVGEAVPAGATVARVLVGGEHEEGTTDGARVPEPEPAAVPAAERWEARGSATAAADPAAAGAAGGRPPNRLSPRERYRRASAARARRAAPGRTAAPPVPTREERRRSVISASVSESWREIPHFGVSRVIAADAPPEALRRLRRRQPDLTVTDLFLAAVVRVLGASGRPPDVGLAVATRAGVALTVLRELESTPEAITESRERAVAEARALRGAVPDGPAPFVTLSNIGALGVSWFTGIVPIGQQALLTTGSVLEQPVVRSGKVVVGATFNAVLNADHRNLDGIDAARLLRDFDRGLQDVLEEVEE
jgi:pyruvate dehydrogenase E2 component (dihydrolipoamide acetyltransferase)